MKSETISSSNISMKDVAEHLGVSKATVSRALSGKSEISTSMKKKIRQACEELGYRLNPSIQDLVLKGRSGKTKNIGFVLVDRDFSDPAYASMMDGIAEGIRKIHYNLVLVKLSGKEENIYDLPPMLRDGRLDGILLTGQLTVPVMKVLKKLHIETVILGTYSPAILKDMNNIQRNLEKQAYDAVELAKNDGCKNIALFEESHENFSKMQTYHYVKAAAVEYNVEFKENNSYHGTGPYSGAIKAMKSIMNQKELPFDCMICLDFRTAGELAALLMGTFRA